MQESRELLLDETDRAILALLERNGRATNEEIGAAVDLSPSAASRRVRSLEQAGVILGYRAALNEQVVGRTLTVFVRVTLERQSSAALAAFEAAIRRSRSITFCYLMAGAFDYLLQIKVGDMSDYQRVHQKELSRLPGVRSIESSFALRDVSPTHG